MARTPAFPNFWQALLLIGFYWLTMSAPLEFLERLGIVSHPYVTIATVLIVSPLCALAVLWMGYRFTRAPLSQVFPMGGFPPFSAVAVVATTAGIWILIATARGSAENAAAPAGGRWFLLSYLVPVIYAPVFEELLHRGLILRGFLSRYEKHTAILLSALLFGLVHSGLGIGSVISALGFGTVVGYIYADTGSLLPCLLIHSTSNFLFRSSPSAWFGAGWGQTPWYPAVGLLLAGGGIGWLLRARLVRIQRAKAYCEKGMTLLGGAERETGSAAEPLFQEACRQYAAAVDLAPDSASTRINWGVALTRYAHVLSGEAQEQLFAQAYEKYSQAFEIDGSAQALTSWGGALVLQAQSKMAAERDPVWAQAYDKFAQALAISPRSHNTLTLWGMALGDQADAMPGGDADRLIDQAREKFEAAAAIEPDCDRTFLAWGDLLMDHATRKTAEEARLLWSDAQRKFERAIDIEPRNARSRRNCATALMRMAEFETGDHAECLSRRAGEHFAAALEVQSESESKPGC